MAHRRDKSFLRHNTTSGLNLQSGDHICTHGWLHPMFTAASVATTVVAKFIDRMGSLGTIEHPIESQIAILFVGQNGRGVN